MSILPHGFMSVAFGDMEKQTKKIAEETKKQMAKVTQTFKNVGKGIGTIIGNPLKAVRMGVGRVVKDFGKLFTGKKSKKVKEFGKNMMGMGSAMLGPILAMASFVQSLGVFEPIMDVIGGLLEIFGGVLMEALMPAFKKLFDVLLSPEVIDLIKMLAGIFAAVLIPIIEVFAEVLVDLMPIFRILIDVIKSFMPIIKIIAKLFAQGLGVALKIVANIIIIVYNVIAHVINAIIGIINLFGAGIPSLPILPLISLQQGGITTGTTMALLHANEKVIPLDKEEKQNKSQELLWATEDNGKKLDELIMVTHNKQRLR